MLEPRRRDRSTSGGGMEDPTITVVGEDVSVTDGVVRTRRELDPLLVERHGRSRWPSQCETGGCDRPDGRRVEATIAPFALSMPVTLN